MHTYEKFCQAGKPAAHKCGCAERKQTFIPWQHEREREAQKTNDECVTITGSLQSTSRKEEDKKDKQTDKTNQKNQEPSQGK